MSGIINDNGIELKGHSGCMLLIKNIDNKLLVYKYSASYAYNDRLMKQAEKQRIGYSHFDTCSVVDEGFKNGLYYFAMEYINGSTLADYMHYIELSKIPGLAERLLSNFKNTGSYDANANDIFKKKINCLRSSIGTIGNKTVLMAFRELDSFGWDYLVSTKCHGDMTLENILISGEKLYLIDFLDSFYDSWMIDLAKILQDLELGWSYRYCRESKSNLYVRRIILRDILIGKVLQMKDGEKIVDTVYHILLLNMLRIMPYVKDDETQEYIKNSLEFLLDILNKKNWLKGAN